MTSRARRDSVARIDALPIVGRDSELALVDSILSEARKGSGRALFVVGEGGIGKTRILTTAAESASKAGWNVVTGRAYAVETGIPYALFSDAFLPVIRNLDPGTLSVLSRGGVAELSHLFPGLSQPAGKGMSAGNDPSELKARLLWNFTQFVGRLAERQPLCIVLENLQWADASSIELLHFIARQLSSQPVALLVSYNDADSEINPALRSTEQSLIALGVAERCRLDRLTATQVTELLRARFGAEGESESRFSERLYQWTLGNPFFIDETLKWLVESGILREEHGQWSGWDMESLQLPPTVRDAVAARLDRLSTPARDLANLGSVVGTKLTVDHLEALSPLNSSALVNVLEELCAHRVLQEATDQGDATYDFAHPILQQVTYAGLGVARARLLHAAVAEGLESIYGKKAIDHAGELAFHFSRSGTLAPKAVFYLTHAGHSALVGYSNREAAAFLESALEFLDTSGESNADRDEIVRNLARAKQRLGEYDEALELWTQARERARGRADNEALAIIEHRMGLACYWSGRFEAALDHYAAGLDAAALIDDRTIVVRLHLARGTCLQELGRLDAAKVEVAAALSAADLTGDSAMLARSHRALLLLHAWTGPADLALLHGLKAIEFAEASGERMLEWTAHWGMSLLAGLTGDSAGALDHIRHCERVEHELRSPLLPLWTAELSLQYASWMGEWDAGLATGERTIALARSLNQRTLLPRLLVWTGLIHLWRGELDRARKYLDEAWELSGAGTATEQQLDVPSVVPAYMGLAAYHLETLDYSEAIRTGEAGREIADKLGYIAWTLQWLLPVIGEAALWNKDFDRAESHSRRMRRDAARLSNPIGLAFADACDGMLLLFRDRDYASSTRLLQQAIDALEAIPVPDAAARIRRVLADAMKNAGDREGATRELRKAHDVFARLGAAGQLTKVRNELRQLGSRPPARTVATGMSGLTGREIEIARMVALRKSNKEIGSALDISARTVSTHLSNIFGKIGLASRGELADFARMNLSEDPAD